MLELVVFTTVAAALWLAAMGVGWWEGEAGARHNPTA